MQSTNLEEIKAALWEQASHQCTKVRFGEAQVMAVRCRKGQLLALCRGWGRWCAVEEVTIERPLGRPNWRMRHRRHNRRNETSTQTLFIQRCASRCEVNYKRFCFAVLA